MTRAALTVTAILCCAGTLRAQASADTRQAHLYVPAAASTWLSTGVIVDKGDRIDVKATGMISVSHFGLSVDANGITRFGWGERGDSYLEYRIGVGSPKPTGKAAMLTADASGELQLRVHDADYSDNYGKLHVDVVAMSADAVPPPPVAVAELSAEAPKEYKPDLGGIVAVMKYTLNDILKAADESFVAKGRYENPFITDRVKLPPGIYTTGFSTDFRGYSIVLKHVDPKVRCGVAVKRPNPLDHAIPERQIVCQWRNFDPPWEVAAAVEGRGLRAEGSE